MAGVRKEEGTGTALFLSVSSSFHYFILPYSHLAEQNTRPPPPGDLFLFFFPPPPQGSQPFLKMVGNWGAGGVDAPCQFLPSPPPPLLPPPQTQPKKLIHPQ
eukprot:Hpha_TRINITY_DN16015_c3_g1::TRINITY_DN16015_c3_g1_i4::g.117068::m.117068